MQKVRVGPTRNPHRGCSRGLLAAISLRCAEPIFAVHGSVVRLPYDNNFHLGDRWMGFGPGRWIVPTADCPWRYINHSCEPNSGLTGRTVVALRRICKGEEITIDYSTTEEDPFWRMSCSCGSLRCRKLIGGIHTLPRSRYRRYLPFIPRFLRIAYGQEHSSLRAKVVGHA